MRLDLSAYAVWGEVALVVAVTGFCALLVWLAVGRRETWQAAARLPLDEAPAPAPARAPEEKGEQA